MDTDISTPDLLITLPNTPYRTLPEATRPPVAFGERELGARSLRPDRACELLFADRSRLAATIAGGHHLVRLTAILVIVSLISPLPYAAVFGLPRALHVSALYLGSVAICTPSLHVFTGYLGCRIGLLQNVVMALLMSAVASLFALAFAPILWFVRLTTQADSSAVGGVSLALLAIALLAGIGHLSRTLFHQAGFPADLRHRVVMLAWQALLILVAFRMALFLGLA